MKNIFVAGSHGFIGQHFVAEALKKGFGVTALTSNLSKSKFQEHLNLEVIEGSVLDSELVNKAMNGSNYLLSAIEDHDEYDPRSLIPDYRVKGTKVLVEAAKKNNIQKMISLLGASLLKLHNGPRILDEADPLPYLDFLGTDIQEARKMWETWRVLKESGLNWSAFCPALVTNQTRTGTYQTKDDEFCDLMTHEKVTVGDLVEAMLAEFDRDEHKGNLIGIRTKGAHDIYTFAL